KAYVERLLDAFEARHPAVRVVRLRPAFVFQRAAATSQRRLFVGPLLPNAVARPGRLPVVPLPAGLRFQAVHADDLAEAYHLAVTTPVRGPFNVAAEPVIDQDVIEELMGARVVPVPRAVVRAGLAAAWHARLVAAEPALLDLLLGVPLLDTGRATRELGWAPRRPATEAMRELLDGLAAGAGGATPPLAPDSLRRRAGELVRGVGGRP